MAKPTPKTPLFKLTLAIGDKNNNGKTDISVDLHAFGMHIVQTIKDIDVFSAVGMFTDVVKTLGSKFNLPKMFGG